MPDHIFRLIKTNTRVPALLLTESFWTQFSFEFPFTPGEYLYCKGRLELPNIPWTTWDCQSILSLQYRCAKGCTCGFGNVADLVLICVDLA